MHEIAKVKENEKSSKHSANTTIGSLEGRVSVVGESNWLTKLVNRLENIMNISLFLRHIFIYVESINYYY